MHIQIQQYTQQRERDMFAILFSIHLDTTVQSPFLCTCCKIKNKNHNHLSNEMMQNQHVISSSQKTAQLLIALCTIGWTIYQLDPGVIPKLEEILEHVFGKLFPGLGKASGNPAGA